MKRPAWLTVDKVGIGCIIVIVVMFVCCVAVPVVGFIIYAMLHAPHHATLVVGFVIAMPHH
jgi:hypothetical protein